jgi:hypothetical protein
MYWSNLIYKKLLCLLGNTIKHEMKKKGGERILAAQLKQDFKKPNVNVFPW